MLIFDLFEWFNWGDKIEINESRWYIKITWTEKYILKKEREFYHLNFYKFKNDEIIDNSYGYEFYFAKSVNPKRILNTWDNNGIWWYNLTRNLHLLKKIIWNNVKKIRISDSYSREYYLTSNEFRTTSTFFENLIKQVNEIWRLSISSKSRLETYLINKEKFSLFNISTKPTTTIAKGDFTFFIDRFNLATKENKKDFSKYLSNKDISKLWELFDSMLKKDVFPTNYFKRINDFFVKEKLQEIIDKWRKLLTLKWDINAKANQKIIQQIFPDENIQQLETAWQRFFEKYLLYLFFSYKAILPKVEFKNIETWEKKYPDFIWINHYDWVDIIEIKTHLKPILTYDSSHENFWFSSDTSKAIIQTINYMDWLVSNNFKKEKDKEDVVSKLNVSDNLYRPRWIIIISSNENITNNYNKLNNDQKKSLNRDFIKLRNSLHNIQIFTFNEILDIADNYIKNISN